MSKNDARRRQLESDLAAAEDAWHKAIRAKREATEARDKAFEKYSNAQRVLCTFLKVLIEATEDGERERG